MGLKIALISIHGLIRGNDLELGKDEDTGGQTRYVIELARALAEKPEVERIELITRQIIDERLSEDYARLEEPIAEKAFIVRIPFGPRRYISKTRIWPYMDVFVDQCLNYFQRTGQVPDIIHSHYADAGYGGAQLARLLGIPFVFTGHSLGRIKQERLLESGLSKEKIESRYNIARRIEAEEFALETCSLIVTSTHQEVKEQYERYEHYIPERMEVIPPGVDLASFRPPRKGDRTTDLELSIRSFLHDPDKPIILAMARPDERKNLEMLVEVYGQSPQLQREANLVIIMGSRGDIRTMPTGQKKVVTRILTLIDVYDLYGKVAYPKNNKADEIPELYRLVTRSKGVFINAAMTEPFGLTILEAAASGAPIIATNNGGPCDIIANCHNGILVDPFDAKAIEKALMHVLIEPEEWQKWSDAGLKNVHIYYSWQQHTDRFLRNLKAVLKDFDSPEIITRGRKSRKMPQIERLILADIDNTLTGDDEAMQRFFDLITHAEDKIGFGIATGRRYEAVMNLVHEYGMPMPEVMITAVGTEIYYGKNLTMDTSWQKHINFRWEPEKVIEVMSTIDGIYPQGEDECSNYKISYEVDFSKAPGLGTIKRILRENGIRVRAILSLGMFLDIIPTRAGGGMCIRHIAYKWGFPLDHLLVAGDSGNDEGMLTGNTLAVVVGNYSRELEKLRKFPRVYFAQNKHAAGIIEGIEYYNFLNNITIPNDRVIEKDIEDGSQI